MGPAIDAYCDRNKPMLEPPMERLPESVDMMAAIRLKEPLMTERVVVSACDTAAAAAAEK